jgi:hypothetical protein
MEQNFSIDRSGRNTISLAFAAQVPLTPTLAGQTIPQAGDLVSFDYHH